MPNTIKYSTTGDTLSLKKGNFFIGTGDVGKGPTSATTYWNGISPPSGGYSVYKNKVSNGPAIWTAASDNQLVSLTNNIEGTSFTTAQQCINYFATQSDKMVLNKDYERIVTDGLVLNLDAGFLPSYGGSGTTWYDLAYSGNNGTLTNGPTYSSLDGGYISFDGTNDTVNIGPASKYLNAYHTYEVWIKTSSIGANTQSGILGISYGLTINILNDGRITYLVYRNETNSYIINAPTTGINVLDNKWHHIVCTRGPSTYEIYVDGVLNRTGSNGGEWTGTNIWASMDAQIGNNPNNISLLYLGNIGIVRIYNRYTLSTEVLQNYNAGLSRFNTSNIVKSGLVLNLDSSNTVSYPTSGTTWLDLSGYGNKGTLTNGPTFDSTSKSIVFDGVDDFVSTTSNVNTLGLTTVKGATMVLLLNITLLSRWTGVCTFTVGANDVDFGWDITPTNGARIWKNSGGATTIDISPYSSKWVQYTLTSDNSGLKFYINDTLQFTNTTLTGTITGGTTNKYLKIMDHWDNPVNGKLERVQLYDRALSFSEIQQNYYQAPIVTDGLVMALDAGNLVSYSGAGTTWEDLTSSGNNVLLTNGPTYSTDGGGCIVFDGSDDYAKNDTPTLPTGNVTTTICAWIYVVSGYNGWQGIVGWGDAGLTSKSALLDMNAGRLAFSTWGSLGSQDLISAYTVPKDTWKYVVGSINNKNIKLYADGVKVLDSSITSTPNVTSTKLRLATTDYPGRLLNTKISNVQIYNRELSADEIAQNYNAYKSRFGL